MPRSATPEDIAAAEDQLIRTGAEALRSIKQTFDRWMDVARALDIGRRHAMHEAGTDNVEDRGYGKAFGRWLTRHPPFDDEKTLPKATRHWLFRCYDHLPEITTWRRDKPLELTRYHYPETVFKRWARVERPELLHPKTAAADNNAAAAKDRSTNGRRQTSAVAALDEAADDLRTVVDDIRGMTGGAKQLMLDLSTPEMIAESARMVIEIYGAAYGNDRVVGFAHALLALTAPSHDPLFGGGVVAPQIEQIATPWRTAPEPEPVVTADEHRATESLDPLKLEPEPAPEPEPLIYPRPDLAGRDARVTLWDRAQHYQKTYSVLFFANSFPTVHQLHPDGSLGRKVRKSTTIWRAAVSAAEDALTGRDPSA